MRETAVRFSAGPRKLSGYYERAAYEYHYQSLINGADLRADHRSDQSVRHGWKSRGRRSPSFRPFAVEGAENQRPHG